MADTDHRADAETVRLVAAVTLSPPGGDMLEVRQAWFLTASLGAVFAAIAATAIVAPYFGFTSDERPIAAVVAGWWIGGWMALFAKFLLRHARSARAAHGWVLRLSRDGLQVNLRSHLNLHFDQQAPAVLVMPRRRIRWLRIVDERGQRAQVASSDRLQQTTIRRRFLDIACDTEPELIQAALTEERQRTGPGLFGRSRYKNSAVRWLDDERVLRVAWRDETNRLRPSLEAVEAFLRPLFRFAADSDRREADIRSIGRAEQEDRLTAMVARGDDLEAIKLARLLYGMDLTEARRFVQELRGHK